MRSYLKTRDFSVSKEEFELLFDEEKMMLITHPRPDSMGPYYDSPDYISHTDSSKTFFEKIYQRVKHFNLKRKLALTNSLSKNKGTLLDIGSGTGDFLFTARTDGWMVSGIEPNQSARQKSSEKGVQVQSSLEEFTDAKFEVITLWHVLEHVANLEESISKISELLINNGSLIVAVPNFKSYDAKFYRSHWAGYDVPRHLWHFSKESIEHIFSEFGFKLTKVKPMWLDAFYVSILSEKYRGGKWGFLKGLLVGCYSNARALFTKEFSSQIYVLKKA